LAAACWFAWRRRQRHDGTTAATTPPVVTRPNGDHDGDSIDNNFLPQR
jgi:hypothetical protein